ncbi:MAG: hypothetical protein GC152_08705 [Alphaproteobacteria bacterium]|nr:hypothetical protein [Alphaproteobacteria bacterium]
MSRSPFLSRSELVLAHIEETGETVSEKRLRRVNADRLVHLGCLLECPSITLSPADFCPQNRAANDWTQFGSSFLLFGGLLESAVTQVGVHLLLDGFDVFFLSDCLDTLEPDDIETFRSRIKSYGGVFLTLNQAVRELAAFESDIKVQSALIGSLR